MLHPVVFGAVCPPLFVYPLAWPLAWHRLRLFILDAYRVVTHVFDGFPCLYMRFPTGLVRCFYEIILRVDLCELMVFCSCAAVECVTFAMSLYPFFLGGHGFLGTRCPAVLVFILLFSLLSFHVMHSHRFGSFI